MNRSAFQERATQALNQVAAAGGTVAFHVIDVDEFKDVNDSLGHDVGDMLLAAIGERLRSVTGHEGVIARLGGDEFAVMQFGATREQAGDLAWRMLDSFGAPFYVDDHHITVNASIGIAVAAEDGSSLAEIMKHADLALYGAKAAGRGRSRFFTRELAEAMRNRRTVAAELKRALDRNELTLAYQPIVSLETGALVGFEALLRWNHPQRGVVAPADFIPLAEDQGMIHGIGRWLLRDAFRQARRWPDEVGLSVNISPVQLRAATFAAEVCAIASEEQFDPRRVTLEITETAVLNNDEATRGNLVALRRAGFRLALDDFGTGYSSLRALRSVPIDQIKIDQGFVREYRVAEASTSIVDAIIAMARSLGMKTTGEGVETAQQAALLAGGGCDAAQGFHFGRPMTADAAFSFALARKATASAPLAASA
jgi:diguanylate cyclase (GGDEF)-like protein